MGADTAIAWTDATFNPWWGCARVSPGCANCYAEAFAKRTGHLVWGHGTERRFFGERHWNQPLRWNQAAATAGSRSRVFCASMADVFEDRPDLVAERQRLWDLIEETPNLDWQLLTKRPHSVLSLIPASWATRWPNNVWVGVTVEDQARADERIPVLATIPSPIRFLSCEPLLSPVDLTSAFVPDRVVDWVIVGGESGPRHRPLDLDWARMLRDQCQQANAAFFFKQVGGRTPTAGGSVIDGETHVAFPAQPLGGTDV